MGLQVIPLQGQKSWGIHTPTLITHCWRVAHEGTGLISQNLQPFSYPSCSSDFAMRPTWASLLKDETKYGRAKSTRSSQMMSYQISQLAANLQACETRRTKWSTDLHTKSILTVFSNHGLWLFVMYHITMAIDN